MPERVTLGLLQRERLEGKELYVPEPGTQYEVAPDVYVSMKIPTRKLSKAYWDKSRELREAEKLDPNSDLILAKLVTEGNWPDDEDDLIDPVVSVIVVDFASASTRISRMATQLSEVRELVENLRLLQQSDGRTNGLTGPTTGSTKRQDVST